MRKNKQNIIEEKVIIILHYIPICTYEVKKKYYYKMKQNSN